MTISPEQMRQYLDLTNGPHETRTERDLAGALQHAVGELLALGVPIQTREVSYVLTGVLDPPDCWLCAASETLRCERHSPGWLDRSPNHLDEGPRPTAPTLPERTAP